MAKTIKDKQNVFKLTFGNETGAEVLADLRVFCHATKSVYKDNPQAMARLAGRQEVFQRIINLMKIDFEEVYHYEEDFDNQF